MLIACRTAVLVLVLVLAHIEQLHIHTSTHESADQQVHRVGARRKQHQSTTVHTTRGAILSATSRTAQRNSKHEPVSPHARATASQLESDTPLATTAKLLMQPTLTQRANQPDAVHARTSQHGSATTRESKLDLNAGRRGTSRANERAQYNNGANGSISGAGVLPARRGTDQQLLLATAGGVGRSLTVNSTSDHGKKYFLALITCVRDEGVSIAEWIKHHLTEGACTHYI